MIAARPDLLVIGGLTVDRFADGSSAAGGSVLHIARAVAARDVHLAVVTTAGPEPEARTALAELRQLAHALESTDADATATFRHRDTTEGRRLTLERRGDRLSIAGSALTAKADVVLVAPVAGEVPGEELSMLAAVPVRAAILQGWLRSLDAGADVRPLPIRSLATAALEALARFDLLVASREDLLAESGDPATQLRSLRGAVGAGPALVVTDGIEGLSLDDSRPGSPRHLAVPRRVEAVSTVGAGDILAAFLAIGDPSVPMERRARDGMEVVAGILEGRRG